jgi:hypothetical protein
MMQQSDGVRNGVPDMVHTPGSSRAGTVAVKGALAASDITSAEARGDGKIALIDEFQQAKIGVEDRGPSDSGVAHDLWTVNEPASDADGASTWAGRSGAATRPTAPSSRTTEARR